MATVRSRGPAVGKFFSTYLRHPKGRGAGQPFLLEPWQQAFVNEFYRVDENGRRVYRLGILGIPRGNGKSPLAGGFGLYETMARRDRPDVYCVAASKDQASIVHDFARAFVETGPLKKLGVNAGRKAITYDRGGGTMKVLAASGSLIHGLNPAAVIGDELHAFVGHNQEETWTAMWTALHKRDDSYGLVITTSGFNKDTLLGRMYDAALEMEDAGLDGGNPCLRTRRDLKAGVLFFWYGVPEELQHDWRNVKLWRQANPASWIRTEDLEKQLAAPGADELDFQRLHLNMWTASRESWLPSGVWAGLSAREGDEGYGETLPHGSKIYVGVDVGWHHDSTAVVWATRLKNGKIALRAKVWTTISDQLGEMVQGGTMRLELVEKFILEELRPHYRIAEIAYDPLYFGRSAELLERKGLRLIEMPPQHVHVTEGWQLFYQHAVEGKLSHNGDPILANHVASAGVHMTANGPRVRKSKSTSRIDALAAAVLAVARCSLKTRPSRNKPNVFWMDQEAPVPTAEKVRELLEQGLTAVEIAAKLQASERDVQAVIRMMSRGE